MNLLTLDEARQAVVVSAGSLLHLAECPDTHRLEQLLWGVGGLDGLSEDDRALAYPPQGAEGDRGPGLRLVRC